MRLLLAVFSTWYILAALYVILSRVSYPFDLEWMEGGSLVEVVRLLNGQPIYTMPHLDYVPYIYPPLYYYISALVARLINSDGFLPLRLVSFCASIGIFLFIFAITRQKTSSNYWGWVAGGFFCATFQIGGAWFDIARVDMLYIFFLFAAATLLEQEKRLSWLFAGLLFTCALFTKQTSILVSAVLLAYFFFFRSKRSALLSTLVFGVSSLVWALIENRLTSGWFAYYLITLPRLHTLAPQTTVYLGAMLLMFMPVLVVFGLGFARLFAEPVAVLRSRQGFWTIFAGGMLALSILASLNPGNFNNNYLPFYASVSLLLGLNMPWLLERFSHPRFALRKALALLLCLAQFAALIYSPASNIPTMEDARAGWELVDRIKQVPGDVLIPNHNALAFLAGKKPYAHLIALEEIRGNFGRREAAGWNNLETELQTALHSKLFGAIILDQPNPIWENVDRSYTQTLINYPSAEVFWPVTGARTRPQFLYIPAQETP